MTTLLKFAFGLSVGSTVLLAAAFLPANALRDAGHPVFAVAYLTAAMMALQFFTYWRLSKFPSADPDAEVRGIEIEIEKGKSR
jgi:hypothetical protein